MAKDDDKSRIKYALYSTTWDTEKSAPAELRKTATIVPPAEYTEAMYGYIYCPACSTGLTRTPRDKLFFANGRRACFAHLPSNRLVPCDLRSTKPEDKLYLDEEEAAQAIANEELVVVSSFLEEQPEAPSSSGEYDQTPIEDLTGPVSEIPIARHRGKTFALPTRVATVASICRQFDKNLFRYYVLPAATTATRLIDALNDVTTVTEPTDTPALYYGKVISSRNVGLNPKPTNIRMTALRCNPRVKDFNIKVQDYLQTEKGISDQSAGRFLIFWGRVSVSGIGLGVERLKWGEFALLPAKYESLLAGD